MANGEGGVNSPWWISIFKDGDEVATIEIRQPAAGWPWVKCRITAFGLYGESRMKMPEAGLYEDLIRRAANSINLDQSCDNWREAKSFAKSLNGPSSLPWFINLANADYELITPRLIEIAVDTQSQLG